ncbi:hypothetical protein OSH08_01680 [Kaistia geumhonensis]|uniref:Uncharacterized protein n=1 Tax=Kaistia geumhonensis TaxID=410839 RepID=A0ABU0M846_9HYPH|nr:hypothetical protein [Kaistia geumhonensis]MCX5477694.1 hypothetical protein [Kaistia geumhonensis]MDQ0517097.1 hypothetical protein [Kaistia geumhonensis]
MRPEDVRYAGLAEQRAAETHEDMLADRDDTIMAARDHRECVKSLLQPRRIPALLDLVDERRPGKGEIGDTSCRRHRLERATIGMRLGNRGRLPIRVMHQEGATLSTILDQKQFRQDSWPARLSRIDRSTTTPPKAF